MAGSRRATSRYRSPATVCRCSETPTSAFAFARLTPSCVANGVHFVRSIVARTSHIHRADISAQPVPLRRPPRRPFRRPRRVSRVRRPPRRPFRDHHDDVPTTRRVSRVRRPPTTVPTTTTTTSQPGTTTTTTTVPTTTTTSQPSTTTTTTTCRPPRRRVSRVRRPLRRRCRRLRRRVSRARRPLRRFRRRHDDRSNDDVERRPRPRPLTSTTLGAVCGNSSVEAPTETHQGRAAALDENTVDPLPRPLSGQLSYRDLQRSGRTLAVDVTFVHGQHREVQDPSWTIESKLSIPGSGPAGRGHDHQ